LAGATNPVYFENTLGNADKVDHIRLLGDNKFAFEDLLGGGDKDFNYGKGAFLLDNGKLVDSTKWTLRERGDPQRLRHRLINSENHVI
jgi:hypothetical protein